MTERWLVPASILAGSVVIALGLYFGLASRAQGPVPALAPVAGAASSVAMPPAVSLPAGIVSRNAGVPAPAELAARDKKAVDAALVAIHAHWVEKCWKPALARAPEPARARYLLNVSFDAAGRQVILGISELRGESRSDVASCMRQQPLSLSVEPAAAGRNVTTEILFP